MTYRIYKQKILDGFFSVYEQSLGEIMRYYFA